MEYASDRAIPDTGEEPPVTALPEPGQELEDENAPAPALEAIVDQDIAQLPKVKILNEQIPEDWRPAFSRRDGHARARCHAGQHAQGSTKTARFAHVAIGYPPSKLSSVTGAPAVGDFGVGADTPRSHRAPLQGLFQSRVAREAFLRLPGPMSPAYRAPQVHDHPFGGLYTYTSKRAVVVGRHIRRDPGSSAMSR